MVLITLDGGLWHLATTLATKADIENLDDAVNAMQADIENTVTRDDPGDLRSR